MNGLGSLYATSTPPDFEAARHWYELAAEAGHIDALNNLITIHFRSTDGLDLPAARPLFERAAEAGHRGAMYWLGMAWAYYMESPDLDLARHWFERAAEAGHSGAMTALGDLYAQSIQPPDLAAARHWYQRASAAGDRGAMHNLEVVFGESTETPGGWGVRPPNDEAMDAMVEWLDGPGAVLGEAVETTHTALTEMSNSSQRTDEAAVRAMYDKVCRRLIDELPAILPTPDPDLTRALQGVIDDANEWSWTDRDLSDPLTPQQRETLHSRLGALLSGFQVVSSVFERDLAILEAADRA
jgi:TPR repeat protein